MESSRSLAALLVLSKAKTKYSVISGTISGARLLIAGAAAQNQEWGKIAGMAIASLLVIVFMVRLIKTKKFMPAGLMILGGVVTLGLAIVSS